MMCQTIRFLIAVAALCATTSFGAQPNDVQFDLRPTVAARSVADSTDLVECEFVLSSLIHSPTAGQAEQWIVQFWPRDSVASIADYSPRTTLGSDFEGPIQVKKLEETANTLGFSIDGDYAKIVHGNAEADRSGRTSKSEQFNRVAPNHAVISSGTLDRGRGVYFKLRWTAAQVLEGEKRFRLTLKVPATWRGGIVDVNAIAQTKQTGFANWDSSIKTLGRSRFVVTVFREGDSEAEAKAKHVATSERILHRRYRELASEIRSAKSLPQMLRHVAAKLELDSPQLNDRWLKRLLSGQADPYMDKEISRLPMELRVAAIKYHDARNEFTQLSYSRLAAF